MSIEATAEALAPEPAMPADQVADTTPELSEDDALAKIWADGQPDEPQEAADEPEQPVEAAQEAEEAEPEAEAAEDAKSAADAPSELPKAVREAWADIPEAARDSILESQREMGRKLADQGRMVQGIGPIRDSLVEAAQKFPSLAEMRPEAVAQEAFRLAEISHNFNAKPVETMMGLIREHKLEEPLRQALSGAQPQAQALEANALKQEIAQLKQQITKYADPEYLRGQVSQEITMSQVNSDVSKFAAEAEHWGAVEDKMPAAIQFVRDGMGEGASPQDVLTRAYELAVSQFVPEATKAKPAPDEHVTPPADPERTKAAMKAKSKNINATSSSKPRTLTEEQELAAVYRKMQS